MSAYISAYAFLAQVMSWTDPELRSCTSTCVRCGRCSRATRVSRCRSPARTCCSHTCARRSSPRKPANWARGGAAARSVARRRRGQAGRRADRPAVLLIQTLNEQFGMNLTDADRIYFEQQKAAILEDPELKVVALHNDREQYQIVLDKRADDIIIDRQEANSVLFDKYFMDEAFQARCGSTSRAPTTSSAPGERSAWSRLTVTPVGPCQWTRCSTPPEMVAVANAKIENAVESADCGNANRRRASGHTSRVRQGGQDGRGAVQVQDAAKGIDIMDPTSDLREMVDRTQQHLALESHSPRWSSTEREHRSTPGVGHQVVRADEADVDSACPAPSVVMKVDARCQVASTLADLEVRLHVDTTRGVDAFVYLECSSLREARIGSGPAPDSTIDNFFDVAGQARASPRKHHAQASSREAFTSSLNVCSQGAQPPPGCIAPCVRVWCAVNPVELSSRRLRYGQCIR